MRRIVLICGAAAALVAAGCSDSSPTRAATTKWSGSEIQVAATNPNAKGELRGVVLDSAGATAPGQGTPIVGATVVLNLKVQVPPASPQDTATTTVTMVGQVVTDANGRFLVTSIPEGDYYVVATPADETHYSGATWAFASSGSSERDATIYLPRKTVVPPSDSLPSGPTNPPPPPTSPPVDSL